MRFLEVLNYRGTSVLMRFALALIYLSGFCVSALADNPPVHITFLNPGYSHEAQQSGSFWPVVSQIMQVAAKQLNIHLEIEYANRDHLLMERQARSILQSAKKPDYLILVNEKRAAESIIKLADKEGVKSLLVYNAFQGNQDLKMGVPRMQYQHWLGTLLPDHYYAGRLLAQSLVEQARLEQKVNPPEQGDQYKPITMLALSGDYVTQASVDRVKGLLDYVAERPDVTLGQMYVGLWRHDRAKKMIQTALSRYPETRIIWAANDSMALGARAGHKDFLKAEKKTQSSMSIGGINWDIAGLEALKSGDLSVDVGGHIFLGAWALVLLKDYHAGLDFVGDLHQAQPGVLTVPVFSAFTANDLHQKANHLKDNKSQRACLYDTIINRDWAKLEFKRFSKVYSKHLKHYRFDQVCAHHSR